jgi:hypothetical protein
LLKTVEIDTNSATVFSWVLLLVKKILILS